MTRFLTTFALLAFAAGCDGKDTGTTGTTGSTTGTTTGAATGAATGAGTGAATGAATGTGTGTGSTAGPYDLTFSGAGYNPHDGQDIWFALWDDADASAAVATLTTATDGQGNISETWAGALVDGHSYTLYWAADLDGDGSCTPPPGDHGWSTAIAVASGAVTITETHNTSFDANVCDKL